MDTITDADEARPAKRVKLDGALDLTEEVQQEEVVDDQDWDIYGEGVSEQQVSGAKPPITEETTIMEDIVGSAPVAAEDEGEVEGVNLLDGLEEAHRVEEQAAVGERATEKHGDVSMKDEQEKVNEDGVPAEAVQNNDEQLIDEEHNLPAADEPAVRMLEELSAVNDDPNTKIVGAAGSTNGDGEIVIPVQQSQELEIAHEPPQSAGGAQNTTAPHGDAGVAKATDDPEFMAAAKAQKDNPSSEWQFDSSDAESKIDISSSDSSDSDSDSDDGEAYQMLDAATAAKILMQGEGDDDDKPKKGGGNVDNQPRTVNEMKEVVVPKPDVVVTEDMKITLLGTVERAVENTILIKGVTSGEYRVLEYGSLLCTQDRKVIGVVGETIGRVQQPYYSVSFTNMDDIKATLAPVVAVAELPSPPASEGVESAELEPVEAEKSEQEVAKVDVNVEGVQIFYVDSHSTFVFTQPLKGLKGTDASNIHDEEVAEEEMEFSDDEAEAEYKRMKKAAKRGGRGGGGGTRGGWEGRGGYDGGARSFGAPGHDSGSTFVNGNGNDAPEQGYGGGMSYDDDGEGGAGNVNGGGSVMGGGDVADDFYNPLKRPDNLSQMMASSGTAPPELPRHNQPQNGDRGRGRGGRGDRGGRGRGDRGRGRGDRGRGGRGRGGFDGGDRGGRGGLRGGFRGASTGHESRPGSSGGNGSRPGSSGGNGGGYRGNAQSYPDRHNNDRGGRGGGGPPRQPQALPPRPASPLPPPVVHQQYATGYGQYPQYQNAQPQQPQQQTYQFGGYQFQYRNAGAPGTQAQQQQQYPQAVPAYGQYAQQQHQGQGQQYAQQYPQQQYAQQQGYQQQAPAAGAGYPQGAYVNPAYYANQAAQQQQAQQGYSGAWQGQQGYGGAAGGASGQGQGNVTAQQQQDQAKLAEVLKHYGMLS
ncbi:hypothetical protein LTR56_004945 [Elasticomyces elasticus]|nr:hypothetical protein LTR22_015760 [Elasticomyces elasticus]KAK3652651.1 hypothetical protein LTR56_004945 [Elasticomyces elasticus]KAK4914581.1 hypothetical protein LTR49_017148 [Elasticomyces elasticus]KAK5753947.1 hypothetical protein LTS12_015913 [Elasticomyces elasticus]